MSNGWEWEVQGNYGGIAGWETLTTEETRREALEMLDSYIENEPQYPHRVKRVRATKE